MTDVRIGLLSDTHGYLDPAILGHFTACDEIWHAGDWGSLAIQQALLDTGKPVRGVYGNIDGPEIRQTMPLDLDWECEGLRVYMTHIGGHVGAWDRRVQQEITRRQPGLFLCGHSHILRVERDPDLRMFHFNPGACGNQGWHTRRTVLRFSIADGKPGNVEVVDLGTRGRNR